MALPLWTRSSLPEPDDTYPYLVRTRQMEECFRQDCPALEDLRRQVLIPSSDSRVAQQRALAASPFHVYHPLFSVLLLFVNMFGLDLVTAYKVAWSLGPVFFSLAFAYFLIALFGVPAAGIALSLMAFKVYPDSGLHYIVPSSLTMGIALIIWARIISRHGDAPWTMALGSLAMAAFHPIGLVYSLMAALIAFLVSGRRLTRRMRWALLAVCCVLAAGLIVPSLVRQPHLVLPPLLPTGVGLERILRGAAEAIGIEILPHIFKGEAALFGSIPLFCLALAFGLVTLPRERRGVVGSTFAVTGFFSIAMLFHMASHPADLFFRVWPPLLTVLFGIVAYGIWYALRGTLELFTDRLRTPQSAVLTIRTAWPVVVLALFIGYACHTTLSGLEHCYGIAIYMRDRQPTAFDAKQPELLLSAALRGDRVLYTSPIVMSYYFACGAMQLGAVYYDPVLNGTETETEWLTRPDIRFAVAYNPTLYHPSYEGLLDKNWTISRPDFIFTPLSRPRTAMPIAVDGAIRAAAFRWIDVEPKGVASVSEPKLLIRNPGKRSWVDVRLKQSDCGTQTASVSLSSEHHSSANAQSGKSPLPPFNKGGYKTVSRCSPLCKGGLGGILRAGNSPDYGTALDAIANETVQRIFIPAGWSGWLPLDVPHGPPPARYRIVLPDNDAAFLIQGIAFGEEGLHWPWAQKALVTFMPKDASTGPICRNFDPEALLPHPLNQHRVKVLDDHGSTVLVRIER